MSILERIRGLVTLAASESANESEARNAAVQACKLIIKHKIAMTEAVPMSGDIPLRNYRRTAESGDRSAQAAEDILKNGVDISGVVDTIFGKDAGNRYRKARESVSKEPAYTANAEADGICRDCRGEYRRGDRIWVRPGVGAVHTMKCDPEVLNRWGT